MCNKTRDVVKFTRFENFRFLFLYKFKHSYSYFELSYCKYVKSLKSFLFDNENVNFSKENWQKCNKKNFLIYIYILFK